MKKTINLLLLFILLIFCSVSLAGQTYNDYRQKRKTLNAYVSQEEIYFIISFGKNFYEHTIPRKKVFIRLDIYIKNPTLHHETNDIIDNYKKAKKITKAFKKNGWKVISPLTQADILIEPIMIITKRKKTNVFIYPCDLDPFYNKKLCRDDLDICFDTIAKKIDYCLQSRGFDPI